MLLNAGQKPTETFFGDSEATGPVRRSGAALGSTGQGECYQTTPVHPNAAARSSTSPDIAGPDVFYDLLATLDRLSLRLGRDPTNADINALTPHAATRIARW
jgi:hypothetical protein